MEVILLEKIRNLGDLGEKVQVKSGFGRNFLIPFGKAVRASKANVERFETMRADLEAKAQAVLDEAKARGAKLEGLKLTLGAHASDEGKLFGSIGTLEIARSLEDKGFDVTKKEIIMSEGAIHEVGEFEVGIQLHTDVTVNVTVEVVAE